MNHRAIFQVVSYVAVYVACLLIFDQAADANYRSHNGVLGATVPAWQEEIVSGNAPAPYVYRQAVPQIRRLAMRAFRPGHVALGVDALFALIAILCGGCVAATLIGPKAHPLGVIVTTLACVSVYPNDKPESVATVAIVCLLAFLVTQGHRMSAACAAALAAPFRPELPILFAAALSTATLATKGEGRVARRLLPYAVPAVAGFAWLALAMWVLWPTARYPSGTPPIMLLRNFATPVAWPGIVLGFLLIVVGGYRAVRAAMPPSRPGDRSGAVGLGLFVCLWCGAMMVSGFTAELRLFSPIIPLALLLAFAEISEDNGAPSF